MMESKEVYDAPVTEVQNDTRVGTVNPVGETLNRYGEEYVGKYRRSFVSRHIQIVTLGSNIGSGLFISTGKALRNAGPGNMIIGYTAVMTMVVATLQALTEMTVAFPVSGSLIDYADRFIDPALAFGIGFGEWLAWTTVLAAEGAAFNVIVQYWTDAVPVAVWMTIILLITFGIHACPVRVFAEVQYATSLLKVVVLLIFIFTSAAMVGGAGPTGKVHDGEYYRELPAFLHNVKGTCLCAIYAIWGVGDQVYVGIMGGETKNPRYSMPRAVKSVGIRVYFFFMLIVIFITLLVPLNDERLLGGSGINASPLVIALNDAGINGIPQLLNAAFLIISATGGLEPLYIASRVMRHMALSGMLPKKLANVDSKGRPTWALFVTGLFTITFTYINCSNTGATIFNWYVSLTTEAFVASTIFMTAWVVLAWCSIRFHAAIRAQGSTILEGKYAYKARFWPVGPIFLGVSAFLVLVGLFADALYPVGGTPLNAYDFFMTYLGVPLVLVATIGYKIIRRTKLRRAGEIDLVTGHQPLTEEQEKFLDHYYSQSMGKRIWSYISTSD
ncbi:AAT family amino acid transporter [Exophiala viscosa]|uniref:AAT family amino acid transporter n=1 Tax=Exophiala viscosa TaxID=2486360 RepID=UPI0021958387|nr:AAT family amino acid transporter [Exophiala viscosa]